MSTEVPTPLPIGISFFDKIIEQGFYYVDKTLFIKDLLDKRAAVTLCTRPRRFGKTLNQTMLKCFFENTAEIGGKDARALFKGLKIEKAGEKYMEHQGKYPVIFLSFKEAKKDSFEKSYLQLNDNIANEFIRHKYVKEKITDEKKNLFEKIATGEGSVDEYSTSVKFLCECLEAYYGKKAVVLIDEYDVPLENSWSRGFYDKMVDFIRTLLSSALKDNPFLEFSVMTGCLRISKESIFTGLNNLDVISILSESYSEHFGFTQDEIDALFRHYKLDSRLETAKRWYDGYMFGKTEVYNPWSSIKAASDWVTNIDAFPRPHWANTSGNDIVRKLVDKADSEAKAELEALIAGGSISKLIHEDITYDEMEKSVDNIWNFLFFTGYLKKVSETVDHKERIVVELKIPNKELEIIFENKIQEWFEESTRQRDLKALFAAVLCGDSEVFQAELSKILAESISYHDSAENFYHGFMAGILSRLNGYRVKSNRESGDGRSDLVLYGMDKAVIFELKVVEKFKEMPALCEDALRQIEERNYAAYWDDEGYTNIIKYGVAFYKKRCEVR
ncbi:MAG: ATP-binding protein, partial [Fibromonadales bacterium]|nr:ATP-binding protein [Fibromonadales bacterium]